MWQKMCEIKAHLLSCIMVNTNRRKTKLAGWLGTSSLTFSFCTGVVVKSLKVHVEHPRGASALYKIQQYVVDNKKKNYKELQSDIQLIAEKIESDESSFIQNSDNCFTSEFTNKSGMMFTGAFKAVCFCTYSVVTLYKLALMHGRLGSLNKNCLL